MKLKYIIPSLIAVVALLMSCTEKFEPSYMDGLRVSSSYVVVPADGGSADFTINASGDWEIKEIPAWLTITPVSGGAGQTKVVATAPATTSTNSATIKIMFGSNYQEVNLVQTAKKTDPVVWSITEGLAQLKANPDGLSATVKGIVCKIDEISPQYGNATYYLSDDGKFGDGNWIEVYRGKWIDGASFTKGDEFAVGDEIVVSGSLIYYKETIPEFTQGSSVVSISKSLIGIEKVEMLDVEEGEGKTEFTKEGGKAKITIMTKGNGFHISIPAEAKSWLHIDDFGADYVILAADANTGGTRKVSVILSTEADGTTYSCEQSFTQKGVSNPPSGTGTKADPFNVPAMLQYVTALGADVESAGDIYVKGKISSIKFTYSAQYGTATYNISADGKEDNVFTVYGSYFFDNKKWEEGQTQIQVGDEVVVCGKAIYYKGTTPEFSNKKNWLVSLNGKTSEGGSAAGTVDNPFTPEQAIAYIDGGGKDAVYVKGIVSELYKGGFDPAYGNGSFWISSDGKKAGDYLKDFEAYQVNYLGGRKWTEADPQIKVGDVVVIYGPLTKFKDTRETQGKGAAYVYSLNGKTE